MSPFSSVSFTASADGLLLIVVVAADTDDGGGEVAATGIFCVADSSNVAVCSSSKPQSACSARIR